MPTPEQARQILAEREAERRHEAKLELVRRYVTNGIQTEEELADFLWIAFGVRLPNVQMCANHTTPWRVFVDAYFARVPVTVVEGSRGLAGKSYSLALLGLTMALTIVGADGAHPDVNVLGGSGEQSRRVLDYMVNWWDLPYMPQWALKSDPAQRATKFMWGNTIQALMASQTSVRGPHPQKLLCFDKDTEILTRAGWKPIASVSLEDEVADVDDAMICHWHKPRGLVSYDYVGAMVTFSGRSLRTRVTAEHQMLVNWMVRRETELYPNLKDEWVKTPALDLAKWGKMGFKMRHVPDAFTETRAPAFIEVGTYGAVPTIPFCRLLGWYLAEGSFSKNNIVINQMPSANLDDILATVERCGFKYSIRTTTNGCKQVCLRECRLEPYFAVLGKSHTKHVPAEIFELGAEAILNLLEALYRGDAMHHPSEAWDNAVLKTRSKQLADDAQRLWLRVGRAARVRMKMARPSNFKTHDYSNHPETPIYLVSAYRFKDSWFWKHQQGKRGNSVAVEASNGERVYCLQTPLHRVIVRHASGTAPLIVGQCDEIDEMDVGILDAALGQPMARHDITTTVVLSSTWHNPNGTMTEIKRRAKEKGWKSVSYCYHETLQPHGWLNPIDVETKRINMTAASFQNEVELQEPAPGSRAIQPDKVEQMFRRELGEFRGAPDEYIEIEPPRYGALYVTGADWARSVDWTIITTFRVDVFPARLVAFERRGRVDWPMMVKRLDERSVRYGTDTIRHGRAHDATGIGDVVNDYLGYEAEGIQMRGMTRADMLSNYIKAIEEGEIEAPFIEWMYEEHKLASVADVFQTGEKYHLPDTISAGALAWYKARQMVVENRQAGARSI